MKEQAVQKINKIGKISSVVALICKILVGIGMVAVLLASIVCFCFPKGSLRFACVEKFVVEENLDAFREIFSDEEIEEIWESADVSLIINGREITSDDLIIKDNVIETADGELEYLIDIRDLAWMVLLIFFMLALIMVTLIFAGGLCKAFRDCQSPFEENVIKKMQHFAYSLIPLIVASGVISSIGNMIATADTTFGFSLDLGMVLVVLVVFLLVYIFKYGAVLQQESDETL